MTWDQILGLVLTMGVMGIGVLGCVLPGLPGTPIVLLAAIGHRLYFGTHGAATWVLWALGIITLGSLVMDYVVVAIGAKRFGGTWKGVVGAVLGGLVGMFFNLPGILLGPLIGALLFELLSGRKFRDALRAGAGAAMGLIAGSIGKLGCCLVMIGMFMASVLLRSF